MHKHPEPPWAFVMITLMHDNPLLGWLKNPTKILTAIGVASGQRVLDVGCGPGFFTIPAAKLVGEQGRVFALDNQPLAIRHVEKKAQKADLTNVVPILADAAHTGLPEASVDLAFLFGFVHAVNADFSAVLNELGRVLKKQGVLAVEKTPWVRRDTLLRAVENQGFVFLNQIRQVLVFERRDFEKK